MKKLLMTTASVAALAASANAATIHALGVDGTKDSGNAELYSAWNGGNGSGTFTGLAGTADGQAFTYDLTITPFGSPDALFFGTGIVTENASNGNFNTGEGIVVTISNISNVNVTFDGFTYLAGNNTGGDEGFLVEGITSYSRNDSDGTATVKNGIGNNPEWNLINTPGAGDLSASFAAFNSAGGAATVQISTLEYQFSAVPEPSSTALLGLGGLALILRRRK